MDSVLGPGAGPGEDLRLPAEVFWMVSRGCPDESKVDVLGAGRLEGGVMLR